MAKHVLVISQCFYPEEFRINDISAELVKRGYKVTALTGVPNYPQGESYKGYGLFKKRRETWNGVDIIHIPIIPRGHSKITLAINYASFVVSGLLWAAFTRLKPDLVFSFETSPMTQVLVGTQFSKRRGIPHYLYVQDLWPENVETVAGVHNEKILSAIGKMVNYIYRRCTVIFATSPSFVKNIQARAEEKEKVKYLPQYAEDLYIPLEKQNDESFGGRDCFKIIFTGNIGAAQGLEILPEAAGILKKNGLNVRFVIVGDGRDRANFESSIDRENVKEMFELTGRKKPEEIPKLLSACDAAFISFMDSPLFEMTIPAKLQSYMACGIPVIAAASGETQRIINEAGCGVCSPLGDPSALAETISGFMLRDDLKQLGINALNYCREHFDKAGIIDMLEKEFNE